MGPHAARNARIRGRFDSNKPNTPRWSRQKIKESIMNPIQMESLEVRIQMAVTAAYLPFAQSLTVFGDSLNINIAISRDAAGKILVNGGAVPIVGGTPTVANTSLISVF